MTEPKIDREIIATIKSARALSHFAHYVKSLDDTLTLAGATAVAAAIVQGLPSLFDDNPDLLAIVLTVIAETKDQNCA